MIIMNKSCHKPIQMLARNSFFGLGYLSLLAGIGLKPRDLKENSN